MKIIYKIFYNNRYAEGFHNVCLQFGIKVDRYDYNEAQRGKDEADRVAAVMKRYINSYVDSGGNVRTAEEIKDGILYKGGPKNVKVCVLDLSKETKLINIKNIQGISTIHSIEFSHKYMKVFQYFNIGCGRIEPFNGVTLNPASKIISDFSGGEIGLPLQNLTKKNTQGKSD